MARVRRGRYRGLNLQDVMTATAEGKVRYGQQRADLTALVGQAEGTKKADIRSARNLARSSIKGARKARKPLAQIYDRATGAADSAASDVQAAFGKLGAAADPFEAATAREQGAARTRLQEAKTAGLSELVDRQQEARAGRQFAVRQAKENFRSDMDKLAAQLSALGDQEGAYVAGRIGALGQARADRRTRLRVERMGNRAAAKLETQKQSGREKLEGIKAANKREADAAKLTGPGGTKPATRAEKRAFTTNFEKALRYAEWLRSGDKPWNRSQIADALIKGQAATKENPGIPSIGDQTAISAALDQVFNGSLTPQTAKKIKRLGIRPRSLPSATTPAEYRAQWPTGPNQKLSSQYGWGY